MSEMVERVMDAIMAATPGYIYEPARIEAAARNAIAAMREPTEAMLWEIQPEADQVAVYKDLIDEALKE